MKRVGNLRQMTVAYTGFDMSRSLALLTTLAFTGPFALAQTTAHHATAGSSTAHHTAAAAHAAKPAEPAGPPCITLPPISDKIPALPASVGCPKVMFTVSDRLDYINPLAERFKTTLFSELPVIISLGYADISQGTGELAKPQQYYTVKYTGWLTDGTKFDSSEDHEETKAGFPFPYGAHRVIAGWDLGFEGMHIGGKRRLYIPYQFAYGAQGKPPAIPPKSMLIFDMELVSQSDQPPAPPAPPAAPPAQPGAPAGTAPATTPPPPGSAPKATPPPSGQPAVPPTPPKPQL